jgi:hypothetical protein
VFFYKEKIAQAIPVLQTVIPVADSGRSTPTPRVTPRPTTTSQSQSGTISADIAAQMDKIQEQVVELRGLEPAGTFTRALLTSDQLRVKVKDDFLKDYTPEDAQKDVIVLSALGLLEPDFDMLTFYVDLLSEQVAGYYDNETKEMYVVQGKGFGGVERITYAHEYNHALQDENYDIKNGLKYDDEFCEQESERCAAVQSLLEGDASLLEMNWLTTDGTPQDMLDVVNFAGSYQSPVYDSAPDYMKEDFLFPYSLGQEFVQYLYDQGGWAAVDAAYRDLPVSTEQILHPERYPDDKPIPVILPDLSTILGDGWRELDRGVMGEWYTLLILAHGLDSSYQLNRSQAEIAAEGWGGDSYVLYYNDQDTVLVLATQWDTASDAGEFDEAFRQYATDRFGQPIQSRLVDFSVWEYAGGYSEFHYNGERTTWILAPNADIAQAVWNEVGK